MPQDAGVMEIDQWVVDFAHLFRDSTGVEFDKHVELSNLGWDKIQVLPRPARRALPCPPSIGVAPSHLPSGVPRR